MFRKSSDSKVSKRGLGGVFYATELIVFLSQVAVFFLVAFFTTDLLSSEKRLTEFVVARVNGNTMRDLGLTLLAITVWLGVLTIIAKFVDSPLVAKISNEVINELPRTIYFFGSSTCAAALAVAVYTLNNPLPNSNPARYFSMAAGFALGAFTYGCALKSLLIAREPIAAVTPSRRRLK